VGGAASALEEILMNTIGGERNVPKKLIEGVRGQKFRPTKRTDGEKRNLGYGG